MADSSENVDIVFAGDYCPGLRTAELCKIGRYEVIFNNTLQVLQNKDFGIINLECPLTLMNNPIKKVGPHLRGNPECVNALRYAGFDIAALANNHILDHGAMGIRDTLENCQRVGIKTVGAGITQKDAERPLIISKNGVSIGIINCTENEFSISINERAGAFGLDPITIYYKILELKKGVDTIILIIHGGNEHYPLPNPEMVKLYRFFADLGVSAIIGHHSHCASGFEIYKGVPIFYSIGNFIFDIDKQLNDAWHLGYLVKLSIGRKSVSKISIYPYEQFKSSDGVHLLEGDEHERFMKDIEAYSGIIRDDQLLMEHWEKFCRKNENYYLSSLFNLNRIQRAFVRRSIGANYFIPRKNMLELLGKIRCEAHREVSIQVLESRIHRGE